MHLAHLRCGAVVVALSGCCLVTTIVTTTVLRDCVAVMLSGLGWQWLCCQALASSTSLGGAPAAQVGYVSRCRAWFRQQQLGQVLAHAQELLCSLGRCLLCCSLLWHMVCAVGPVLELHPHCQSAT